VGEKREERVSDPYVHTHFRELKNTDLGSEGYFNLWRNEGPGERLGKRGAFEGGGASLPPQGGITRTKRSIANQADRRSGPRKKKTGDRRNSRPRCQSEIEKDR